MLAALATKQAHVRATMACTQSARALSTVFRSPTTSPEAQMAHMRSMPPMRVSGHDASEHITVSYARSVEKKAEEPDDGMCYTPTKHVKRPFYNKEQDVRVAARRRLTNVHDRSPCLCVRVCAGRTMACATEAVDGATLLMSTSTARHVIVGGDARGAVVFPPRISLGVSERDVDR